MLMLVVGVVLAVVLVAVGMMGGKMITTMAPTGSAVGGTSTAGPVAALKKSTGLGDGALAGIGFGGFLFILVVGYMIYLETRFRKRKGGDPGLTRRALFASDRAAVGAAPGAALDRVRKYDYRGAPARTKARARHALKTVSSGMYRAETKRLNELMAKVKDGKRLTYKESNLLDEIRQSRGLPAINKKESRMTTAYRGLRSVANRGMRLRPFRRG